MRGALACTAAMILAALAAAPLVAQQPSFRSGVQLLEVDARVFDRDGRFVGDLAIEDFEVLDEGIPQKLQTFFLVSRSGTAATSPAGAANVPRAPHTWIFIFDQRHMRLNGFVRARRALAEFLKARFRPGDLAGVVFNDRMINNRISSVPAEFLAALDRVKLPGDAESRARDQADVAAMSSSDPSGGYGGEADAHIKDLLNGAAKEDVRRAVENSLGVLDELARGLARMPGPKTTILFTDGFGHPDYFNTLRTVVGRLGRAGARVYALDTRGLAGAPGDFINSLAIDTGGMVIFNENNMGRALDDVAADTNVYYVLGYQPSNTRFDGKYRKIEVRVKRPGTNVRARKGYLALPPDKMNVPKPIR